MQRKKATKYILYARKSSEARERQEASLGDQKAELQKIAEYEGLNVVEVIEEAKSAKAPGREGFNTLIAKIDSGEVDGILCWKLNRLSRNPIDGAQIQWRLQQGILKHIRSYSGSHYPEDNVLQVQVELGMANQFIKDLRIDVQRGMRQKAMRGWYPSTPPLGYISKNKHVRKPGEDEIQPHPEDFPKVKLLWNRFLTGTYTVSDIVRYAISLNLSYRNNQKTISYNAIRKMFSRPFYYGSFYWKNDQGEECLHKGKHEELVTFEEWQQVQLLLKKNSIKHSIQKKRIATFAGCITCGECNKFFSVDRKEQVRCSGCNKKFSSVNSDSCTQCGLEISRMINPWKLYRNYYRCSGKAKGCSSKRFKESDLIEQFKSIISSITLDPQFYDFYHSLEHHLSSQFLDDNKSEVIVLENDITKLSRKEERLSNGFLSGLFDDREFRTKKLEISQQKEALNLKLERLKNDENEINDHVLRAFQMNSKLLELIDEKNLDNRMIQSAISISDANLTIFEEKLCFTGLKTLKELKILDLRTRSFNIRCELVNIQQNKHRFGESDTYMRELEFV